jgi:DNA-binding response OmpR family regulator
MRILIAEDGPSERHTLQHAVEALGHSCVVAADGVEAWDLFVQAGADVIISDWLMPRLDGLMLCQRVRAEPAPDYTYFIFLTALSERGKVLEAVTAGADDYLVKPLDRSALRLCLIAAARVTELHRRLRASEHERGRLAGVQLAVRTIEHELRNALTPAVVYNEQLATHPGLPSDLQLAATRALSSVQRATTILQRLGGLNRIAEKSWPAGIEPTIRLDQEPGAASQSVEGEPPDRGW